jgi:hypothetical protein
MRELMSSNTQSSGVPDILLFKKLFSHVLREPSLIGCIDLISAPKNISGNFIPEMRKGNESDGRIIKANESWIMVFDDEINAFIISAAPPGHLPKIIG